MKFTHVHVDGYTDLSTETIDGKRHYVTPSGNKYPSVTTVLGAKPKKWLHEWRARVGDEEANRVSRRASSHGTLVHSMLEDYLNNKDPDSKGNLIAEQAAGSLFPILDKQLDNIRFQECALFSDMLHLAGRVDCVGEWDGSLSIIDFKTASNFKEESDILDYFIQCTMYAIMYEDMFGEKIDNIVVLIAVSGGQSQVFVRNPLDYVSNVKDAIEYYWNSRSTK